MSVTKLYIFLFKPSKFHVKQERVWELGGGTDELNSEVEVLCPGMHELIDAVDPVTVTEESVD